MFARLICIAISLTLAIAKLTSSARAEAPAYGRMLSAVSIHFESGAGEDRALLIGDDKNDADLYVHRGVDTAQPPMTPSFIKKNVA
jgi:hypothetical protein